jgi:hypothetical protein
MEAAIWFAVGIAGVAGLALGILLRRRRRPTSRRDVLRVDLSDRDAD